MLTSTKLVTLQSKQKWSAFRACPLFGCLHVIYIQLQGRKGNFHGCASHLINPSISFPSHAPSFISLTITRWAYDTICTAALAAIRSPEESKMSYSMSSSTSGSNIKVFTCLPAHRFPEVRWCHCIFTFDSNNEGACGKKWIRPVVICHSRTNEAFSSSNSPCLTSRVWMVPNFDTLLRLQAKDAVEGNQNLRGRATETTFKPISRPPCKVQCNQ